MIKIKLHSITDLITNSSTVIFTYSKGTIKPLKEMINEILKTFNIDKTCDEMFDTVILSEDYVYEEYLDEIEDDEDLPKGVTRETDVKKIYDDVKFGKLEKPEWFEDVEESESLYDCFSPSNYLHLIPKDKKYEKIGQLITNFLYSVGHEATRDG